MAEKTDAQKRAQKVYMEKFARVEIRIAPETRDEVQAHASARGESTNGFVCRAIMEAIERDETGAATQGSRASAGAVSLPADLLQAAQSAAEAAGEGLTDFVRRAIKEQAHRDVITRKLRDKAARNIAQ